MPPKKKTRPRGKSTKPPAGPRLKVLVASLFLLGFLLFCLIALSQWRRSQHPAPPPAPPAASAPAQEPAARSEEALPGGAPPLPREQSSRSDEQVREDVPPPRPARPGARLAIVMDDLGRDLQTARALLAIDLPVTFAILPGAAKAAEVATLAHRGGREVLIHIPMEPQSYPATDPGEDALLIGHSPEEIRQRFQDFVERVPYAVGGNNHMGSRFTEYRAGMEVVLAAMREADLFFVDSRTSGQSVALAEARLAGVPAAGRDLFLDNDQDVERISQEIRKLVALAGRQGQAMGICHPYPETLEALRREAPYLKQQQVELVPVSALLVR